MKKTKKDKPISLRMAKRYSHITKKWDVYVCRVCGFSSLKVGGIVSHLRQFHNL